mmetsp:Transcript_82924/g.173623  ORF Transcript_82924/g.173623 Transcript_82924/m.173623 type:complete len:270 (-) Transcript_82924:154-963(-)
MATSLLSSLLRPAAAVAATSTTTSPIVATIGLVARLTRRTFAGTVSNPAVAALPSASGCRIPAAAAASSSIAKPLSVVGHRALSNLSRASWPSTHQGAAPNFAQPALASVGGMRSFCKGVFGYPPQRITKKYSGMHCHPGRPFGYPHPRKRQGKVKRLPNVRLRSYDYDILPDATGGYRHRPPYPPRVNRTIPVQPPYGAKKNPFPTTEHKTYRMRWKNIEYTYQPRLMRKPFGDGTQRWSGPVTRIEHHPGGHKTTTLVSHDRRLMPF